MGRGWKTKVLLALVAALIVVAVKTPALDRARAWGQGAERSVYVALAWPVASGQGDLDYIAPVVTKGVPRTGAQTWLIPWRFWTRHGTLWRDAQLHGRSGATVRTAMTYGYGVLGLLLLVILTKPLLSLAWRARTLKPTGAGGTARWATWRDLRRYRPRRGQAKVMLGRLRGRVVALMGELMYLNVLVVAPPGMGKTSGLIIPNLFAERGDRARSWRRRARLGRGLVITDLKGELARKTLGALSRTHRCVVLDVYAPATSAAWNPLAHVNTAAEVREFVECWFKNTGGTSTTDKYFDNSTMLLMQAGILHLKEIHRRDGRGEPTLADLRAFLQQGLDGPARVTQALLDSPSRAAYDVGSNFLAIAATNDKIISGVFTDLPNRLSVLQDDEVCAVTSANEIDYAALSDPTQRPTALYLVLDPDRGQVLTAVFFQQHFKALAAAAKAHGGTLPRAVYHYLDEFGNCGTITNVSSAITTLRAARGGFMLILQTLAQLGAAYGKEGKETIMAGCATTLCLAGTSGEDAAYFSKEADKQTAVSANAGESKKLGAFRPQHDNLGYSEMATELIKPGEIRTLPRDQMVVLSGNAPPMKLRQRAWYPRRYRDNWWMRVQAAMRPGAPWYAPWRGEALTDAGPLRATPLAVPALPASRPTSGAEPAVPLVALDVDDAPAPAARTAPTETTPTAAVATLTPTTAGDPAPHTTHEPVAASDAAAAAPHNVAVEGRVERQEQGQERMSRRPVPPPRPRASVSPPPPPPPPRSRGAGSRAPVPAPTRPAGVSPAAPASPWDDVLQAVQGVQGAPGDGRGRD